MKKILFIIFLLIFKISFSQQLYWDSNVIFGGNVDIYRGGSMKIDSYNNKYIIGDINYSFNFFGTQYVSNKKHYYYLIKLSPSDSLIWLKSIGEGEWNTNLPTDLSLNLSKNNEPIIAYTYFDSITTFSNTYYSEGYLDTNTNQYVSIYKNIFLMKLDTSGNLIWGKSIEGNFDESISHDAIGIDNDNNIILAGTYGEGINFPPINDTAFCDFGGTVLSSVKSNIFIAKYDSNGILKWVEKAGGSGSDGVTSLNLDSNNNIYFIGNLTASYNTWFDSIHVIFGGAYNDITYIAKYNKEGAAIWVKYFYITPNQSGIKNADIEILNSNIYLVGTFVCPKFQSAFFDNIQIQNFSDKSNGYIAKLDTNGNMINVFTLYNNFDGNVTHFNSIKSNNSLFVAVAYDGNILSNNDTIKSMGQYDLVVTQINTAGIQLSQNYIKGGLYENILGISLNSNNELYVCGNSNSTIMSFDDTFINPAYQSNLFLAKLTQSPTSIQETTLSHITLYPNPAHTEFVLSSSTILNGNLYVYNTLGQLLLSQKINASKASISTSTLPNGMYIVQFKNEQNSFTQKIIIQH